MDCQGIVGYWWLLPAVAGLSFALTFCLIRYAHARRVLDIPNARSSHTVPTPRGGGVAIVVSFLVASAALAATMNLFGPTIIVLLGAGGLVALVGFIDDHRHLAARWRLLAHFVAAAWVLMWLGAPPPMELFGLTFDQGLVGGSLAAIYLVWLLNLYNFMDGIDGIAGAEAICVCLGGALLSAFNGQPSLAVMPVLLAAAVVGFLWWNFPPARIFMGDSGSGFLGIVLGIFSIQAVSVSLDLFLSWLILLGVFIVDATWTLLRRLLRGMRIYEAHRSHAYQHAARRFGRHLPVTLCVCSVNLFWLLPLALAVGTGRITGLVGIAMAYIPLLFVAVALHAGEEEDPVG